VIERSEQDGAPAAISYDDVWRDVYGDMQDVGPVHRHMRRILAGVLAGLDYGDALDVGCGAGHNLELLTSPGCPRDRISGMDVSSEALGRARERGEGSLFQLDIERDALDGTWDLVFSSLVLEHLVDDVAALRNMRAMARRHVVLTTICGDFDRYRPWEEAMGHVRNYRRGELEGKLAAAGLAVRRSIHWGYPFYSPLVRRVQNRWRAQPAFDRRARMLARALYGLYWLNSSRRGDLLVVHATVA